MGYVLTRATDAQHRNETDDLLRIKSPVFASQKSNFTWLRISKHSEMVPVDIVEGWDVRRSHYKLILNGLNGIFKGITDLVYRISIRNS